jgi:methyltransferase (TIGR00027 family)
MTRIRRRSGGPPYRLVLARLELCATQQHRVYGHGGARFLGLGRRVGAQHRLSRTAQHVALFRALESTERVRPALFHDRFAQDLLPRSLRFVVQLARIQLLRERLKNYVDTRLPGARAWVVVRTCFIDERVQEALRAGVRQYVLLGAGYDCRAHRIEALAHADVFEVDRAETQNDKRRRLARTLVPTRQRLRYVAADFGKDEVAPLLLAAGFDPAAPTLFICEGVMVYLDASTVDRLLRFVGSCAEGSQLVFTYCPHAAVQDNGAADDSHRLRSFVRGVGEPWTFGIEPSELAAYLARFNLRLERDVGVPECVGLYQPPPSSAAALPDFSHLAVAAVDRHVPAAPEQP